MDAARDEKPTFAKFYKEAILLFQLVQMADLSALEGLLVACSRSDSTVKMQRGAGSRGTLEGLCRRVARAVADRDLIEVSPISRAAGRRAGRSIPRARRRRRRRRGRRA